MKVCIALQLRQNDPEYFSAMSKHLAFLPAFPEGANLLLMSYKDACARMKFR